MDIQKNVANEPDSALESGIDMSSKSFLLAVSGILLFLPVAADELAALKFRYQEQLDCVIALNRGASRALRIAEVVERAALAAARQGERPHLQTAVYRLPPESFNDPVYALANFLYSAPKFVFRGEKSSSVILGDILAGEEALPEGFLPEGARHYINPSDQFYSFFIEQPDAIEVPVELIRPEHLESLAWIPSENTLSRWLPLTSEWTVFYARRVARESVRGRIKVRLNLTNQVLFVLQRSGDFVSISRGMSGVRTEEMRFDFIQAYHSKFVTDESNLASGRN